MSLGKSALAVTADSPSVARYELEAARKVAREIGIEHIIVRTTELENPDYARNLLDRCYYCKKELFLRLKRIAEDRRIRVIVDGTNADDLVSGHRPGAVAEVEEGIRRPLAELGISKAEVRSLSRSLNLSAADKPAEACLSSRIAYGEAVTLNALTRIERAESVVRDLTGVKQIRVRQHGELARIEVGRDERRRVLDERCLDEIDSRLKALGFKYVTFELGGYVSGSMNESIPRDANDCP